MTSEGQCGNTFSLEAKGNLHLLHLYIVARFITEKKYEIVVKYISKKIIL